MQPRFSRLLLLIAVSSAPTWVACSPVPDTAAGAPSPVFGLPTGGMTLELLREPVPVGDVTMETLDGRTMSTRDWQGKVTLVNFWATWCGPCRQEIPDLIRLQERYPDHLQVIGISTDEGDPSLVRAFADEMGMNYPVVMATT